MCCPIPQDKMMPVETSVVHIKLFSRGGSSLAGGPLGTEWVSNFAFWKFSLEAESSSFDELGSLLVARCRSGESACFPRVLVVILVKWCFLDPACYDHLEKCLPPSEFPTHLAGLLFCATFHCIYLSSEKTSHLLFTLNNKKNKQTKLTTRD